jgi:methylated-DNA-[protein]-cysteine S-methyltransferase
MELNKHKLKIKIIKSTPFGPVALIWSIVNGLPKIINVLISKPEESAEDQVGIIYPNAPISSCTEIDAIATDIKAFLEGEDRKFSLDSVFLDICSPFQL